MAKRRKRRKRKSNNYEFEYWNVVAALILIVLPILAFGVGKPLGIVGKYIRIASVYMFGMFDWLFLVGLFILGLYLLFKKELPRLISTKSIGLMIFLVGLLALAHIGYADGNKGFSEIQAATGKDLGIVLKAILAGSSYTIKGAGLTGGILLSLFTMLFDKTGTTIVSIVFIALGITVFTGFSIRRKKIKRKIKMMLLIIQDLIRINLLRLITIWIQKKKKNKMMENLSYLVLKN